jgi:DNA-binding transcriptional LysR family regulator
VRNIGAASRPRARRQIDIALLPGPVDLMGALRVSLGSFTLKWLGHPHFRPKSNHLTAAEFGELATIGMPRDASVYHSMVSWPRNHPSLQQFQRDVAAGRRGIGVSLLPAELFTEDLAQAR